MTKPNIYIASKTQHAPAWQAIRDKTGLNIISTWVDKAGVSEAKQQEGFDFHDLWTCNLNEVANSDYLLVYRKPGEILKGGMIEIGAALASNIPVVSYGLEDFEMGTIGKSRFINHTSSVLGMFLFVQSVMLAAKGGRYTKSFSHNLEEIIKEYKL